MQPTLIELDTLKKIAAGKDHEARLRISMGVYLDGLLGANHTAGTTANSEVKGFAATERPLIDGYVERIIEGTVGDLETRQTAFFTDWCKQANTANAAGTMNSSVKQYNISWLALLPQVNVAIAEGMPHTQTAKPTA